MVFTQNTLAGAGAAPAGQDQQPVIEDVTGEISSTRSTDEIQALREETAAQTQSLNNSMNAMKLNLISQTRAMLEPKPPPEENPSLIFGTFTSPAITTTVPTPPASGTSSTPVMVSLQGPEAQLGNNHMVQRSLTSELEGHTRMGVAQPYWSRERCVFEQSVTEDGEGSGQILTKRSNELRPPPSTVHNSSNVLSDTVPHQQGYLTNGNFVFHLNYTYPPQHPFNPPKTISEPKPNFKQPKATLPPF